MGGNRKCRCCWCRADEPGQRQQQRDRMSGDRMSGDMGPDREEHYLELCENPVQFEHASGVNNVFFDEANKQVGGGLASG